MPEHAEAATGVFPLSLNQQNIWSLEQSVPGTSINNISATIRIKGKVNLALLQKTLCLILEQDASLRTRITLRGGVPVQYHAPRPDGAAPLLDFSSADEESFSHWANAYTQIPIFSLDAPLYRFVLCRTGERSACLLVETHHIISDGWSQIMLCNRISEAYLAFLSGNVPAWEPFPDYADYIRDELCYLDSDAYLEDQAYWRGVLRSGGEAASIKPVKGAVVSQVGRRKSYRLSQQLNHAIFSFCREHRVAPFTVFFMALAIYLKRLGSGDRFAIGVPVFNRSTFLYKQTTGMFVSTLPFYAEISDQWSFQNFQEHLSDCWLDMLRHQRFPFSHIEALAVAGEPLFHLMLSYQDSRMWESPDASVQISGLWHYSGFQVEQLCIHMTNLEDNRVYSIEYDYLTQLFSEREIEELHQYLCHILLAGLQFPDAPIRSLPILNAEERERVLYRFNQTHARRGGRTPYQLFEDVAANNPRRAAVICKDLRMTYQELRARGARVAAALPEAQALVAVLLPRDERLFTALTGIMQANCAWLLLSPEQPAQRLREILRQSGAACLLATPALSSALDEPGLPVLDIDALPDCSAGVRVGKPDDLAYVVYTSGSTGTPKGVEIAQKSLVNLASVMRSVYRGGAILSLCSVGFDAFLLESAVALLCGQTVLLPDERQREDPAALAELILNYGVGFLSTTPSRLSALLNNQAFALALRRLESIVCGGEAFPSELLQRLIGCTDAHIYNQYGPSETAVAVSSCRLDCAQRITIGRPLENCRLYVLDDDLQPLPPGIHGQLYIGGVCVGRGYRNADELTARYFLPSPFESGERLYKTGDVACWTADGELELAGRLDRQIKLRGLRVEPQEIAACLLRHPDVTDAAARALIQNGQTILVGYYVSARPIPEVELLAFAASYLPNYMIPAHIMALDAIPLTANGKIDERRLPAPAESVCCPQCETPRQQQILDIFRRALNADDIHADSSYFLSGGNSLNAMETISQIEERFGVRLMISDLYACRTARRLDEFLALGAAEPGDTISPAPLCDRYPLSATQTSMYIQSALGEDGLAYHMPCAFTLSAPPDSARLEGAFRALLADDPLLRTCFTVLDGELAAVIEPQVEFSLPILTADSRQDAFAQFMRPFDLAAAPLLRAALWQAPDGVWLLLVDVHHIIGDGLSTPILLSRLSAFFRSTAPAAHLSYHDYAWYCAHRGAQDREANKEYWAQALAGYPLSLDLPTDRPRPPVFDFHGGAHTLALSQEAGTAADRFCAALELTPYMLFAGALGIVLSRLSGQSDLILGTPTSGRSRPELRDVCGPLMGTLPLRLQPQGTLEAYFQQVKTSVLAMLDHADCSLEDILEVLNVPRSTAQNPLYQVLFQMRPVDTGSLSIGELCLDCIPIPTGTAKLDLSIEAARLDGRYHLFFEYASSLFDPETVAFYGRCLEALLCRLPDVPRDIPIEAMEPLSPADKLRCFDRPQRMVYPYLDLPIHRVIEEEALLHPDSDAVIWHGQHLSFASLEARACRIAGVLTSHGAVPGDHIGLVCLRGPDLLAALLAILKAGCAYVPFLADYPAARVAYMMETADVRLILCDAPSAQLLPEEARVRPLALLDESAPPLTSSFQPQSGDTMYILFTSGSTGQPKGVALPHRALSNLLQSLRGWMEGESGPVLCITNVTFDIFITETLLALAQGYAVVLADEEEMLLPWKLAELITAHQPHIAQFTPSRLQMCLRNTSFAAAAEMLSFIIVAGEMVSSGLISQFKAHCAGRLVNMYGPTEAAVYVTAGELREDEPITIGAPLNNCRIYVLDKNRRPVLPTALGEMYLAGPGLADGYVGRPELTQELFLDDPFFRGERMYRSGDVGRLRMDGRLECLGRTDTQVKINGNRVELGEVTDALRSAGAEQAAAIPWKNPDGSSSLCAVVTPQTLDPAELRRSLALRLPSYMIPGLLLTLPRMPYNSSGKLDMPTLRSLVERNGSQEYPALLPDPTPDQTLNPTPEPSPAAPPESEQAQDAAQAVSEAALLEIWRQVLQQPALRADLPLFEQGGTSLSALSILSEYYNRNISMTLAEFYRAPTVRAQAALLESRRSPAAAEETPVFQPVRVPPLRERKTGPFLTVFLTGATGFLGAHLLRALLERGCPKVICLLRDGDAGRLCDTLSWYFGSGWTAGQRSRLEVCRGDMCLPEFGMARADYDALAARTDAVYHAAGDVRHYAADDALLRTNLEGARQTIAFAQAADAALYHISTASIAGSHVRGGPGAAHIFTEDDLDIGQNWQDNAYLRGKFLAEREICQAVEDGLCARIFRVGRLIGRCCDGVFQKAPDSNAFFRVMRGIGLLQAIPETLARLPLELTPVDLCAESIVALQTAGSTVYHVIEPDPAPLGQTLRLCFPQLELLSDSEFSQRLSQASAQHAEALASLVDLWNGLQQAPGNVTVSCEKTHRLLREASTSWPQPDLGHALDLFGRER